MSWEHWARLVGHITWTESVETRVLVSALTIYISKTDLWALFTVIGAFLQGKVFGQFLIEVRKEVQGGSFQFDIKNFLISCFLRQ